MKRSGREKRAEISLALFMLLVFCLFISAFDSSQPRDVNKMSDPPAFYVCLYFSTISFFLSFPLCFLSLSFPLYFLFSSFYSMLLYLLLSLYISPCLLPMIFLLFHFWGYCLPLFFFLRPLSFSFFVFVSFIAFKSFL